MTTIQSSAFEKYTNLTRILLPNSVVTVGDDILLNGVRSTDVALFQNLMTIGDSMFKDCRDLENIIIFGVCK